MTPQNDKIFREGDMPLTSKDRRFLSKVSITNTFENNLFTSQLNLLHIMNLCFRDISGDEKELAEFPKELINKLKDQILIESCPLVFRVVTAAFSLSKDCEALMCQRMINSYNVSQLTNEQSKDLLKTFILLMDFQSDPEFATHSIKVSYEVTTEAILNSLLSLKSTEEEESKLVALVEIFLKIATEKTWKDLVKFSLSVERYYASPNPYSKRAITSALGIPTIAALSLAGLVSLPVAIPAALIFLGLSIYFQADHLKITGMPKDFADTTWTKNQLVLKRKTVSYLPKLQIEEKTDKINNKTEVIYRIVSFSLENNLQQTMPLNQESEAEESDQSFTRKKSKRRQTSDSITPATRIENKSIKLQFKASTKKLVSRNGILIKCTSKSEKDHYLLICDKDGELAVLKKQNFEKFQMFRAALQKGIFATDKNEFGTIVSIDRQQLKENPNLPSPFSGKTEIYALSVDKKSGTIYGHAEKTQDGKKVIVFDTFVGENKKKSKHTFSQIQAASKQATTSGYATIQTKLKESKQEEIDASIRPGIPYQKDTTESKQEDIDSYSLWVEQIRSKLRADIERFKKALLSNDESLLTFYHHTFTFRIRDLVLTLLDNEKILAEKSPAPKVSKWFNVRLKIAHDHLSPETLLYIAGLICNSVELNLPKLENTHTLLKRQITEAVENETSLDLEESKFYLQAIVEEWNFLQSLNEKNFNFADDIDLAKAECFVQIGENYARLKKASYKMSNIEHAEFYAKCKNEYRNIACHEPGHAAQTEASKALLSTLKQMLKTANDLYDKMQAEQEQPQIEVNSNNSMEL